MERLRNIPHSVFLVLLCCLVLAAKSSAQAPAGKAEHVVIIVFDGLRPDSVTEQDAPTLFHFAQRGTTFANHHSVFLSSTEVNGTAIATGMSPGRSGIVANDEYKPEIELLRPFNADSDWAAWTGDRLTHGQYLRAQTLTQSVQHAGRSSAVAGTKGVALLLDRASGEYHGGGARVTLYEGRTLPAAVMDLVRPDYGPMPPKANPKKTANAQADRWTTNVLIDKLWNKEVPALTMLWLSEPDYAQHGAGPGSKVGRAAVKSSDDNLTIVLKKLQDSGLGEKTDVLVVSDHGFSTISRAIDLADLLKKAGFRAGKEFDAKPAAGDVMVVGHGGSASIYVGGRDTTTIEQLVEFLQKSDFAGVIFTRHAIDGTFTLDQAGLDSPDAPDIVVSFRWSDEANAVGLPGMVISDSEKRAPGQGIHASLSRFDMHNTLIAAGPDFRAGFIDHLPSGNMDLAPTVLQILGIKSEATLDGRVLTEALSGGDPGSSSSQSSKLSAERKLGDTTWSQYLNVSKVENTAYYDDGNGATTPLTK